MKRKGWEDVCCVVNEFIRLFVCLFPHLLENYLF